MKRILLSLLGTIAGLVALLSFKTQSQPTAATGGLPSATLPGTSSTPVTAPTSTSGTPAAGSRTYLGSAIQTHYGVVQVSVSTIGTKITNVSFKQLTAFEARSQQINSHAAPILLQETLQAQSAHIDTVSGATYTSEGYLRSLQSALDQAGLR